MKCTTHGVLLGGFLLIIMALTGCQKMKAEPSKGAGLVPMDEMQHRADLPFNKVWVKGARIGRCTRPSTSAK